jgi:hypothetical protein
MMRRVLAVLTVGLVGCATARPILYSNEKYQQAGKAGVDHDIADCEARADQAGATPGAGRGGQLARGAGVGAVSGAAAGAVGGAIWGNAGRGAASGAAAGVVGGILWPVLGGVSRRPSEAHVNYVNQCLTDRGYQVAGWK